MLNFRHILPLLLAVVVAAVPAVADKSQELVAILKSDAPAAEKALTCKHLAIYGGKDAAPALAPLLADEKLASWARIALQAIPDPAAADALRDALDKLQGNLLIGAINSLGVRRDTKSIAPLAEKLKAGDADVASAAAVALGRIGGPTVVSTLTPLLAGAPAAVRPAVAEGCILCAEGFLAEGKFPEAVKLYDAVRGANVSKQKTIEATRGAILARQSDGIRLLAEQLESKDRAFFNIGLRTAREIPGPDATKLLIAEMERAAPDRRPHLLLALADRGGSEVLPAALKAAKSGSTDLRLTAIKVLDSLSDPSCAPVLVAIAAEDDATLAQAAKSALIRLPGAAVDAAAVALMKESAPNIRRVAVELVGARRVLSAMPALLETARDPNPDVAAACLKALGDMAGSDEIPALLNLMMKTPATDPVESALAAICARLSRPIAGNVVVQKAVYGDLPDGPSSDVTAKVAAMVKTGALSVEASNGNFGDPAGGRVKKLRVQYTVNGQPVTRTVNESETVVLAASAVPPVVADALCSALPKAEGGAKLALLRVLRSAGGSKALAAIRAAAGDSDAGIKETALRALCDWESADALPDMVQLAQTATDKKWKILALRAQLRLIPMQEASLDQKLESLKGAMTLIERPEERRLALAALGEIPTAGSLALVAQFLNAEGLQEEAGNAAVAVAERIVAKHPAEVAAAMKQVTTTDKKLAQRARQLQQRAEGK